VIVCIVGLWAWWGFRCGLGIEVVRVVLCSLSVCWLGVGWSFCPFPVVPVLCLVFFLLCCVWSSGWGMPAFFWFAPTPVAPVQCLFPFSLCLAYWPFVGGCFPFTCRVCRLLSQSCLVAGALAFGYYLKFRVFYFLLVRFYLPFVFKLLGLLAVFGGGVCLLFVVFLVSSLETA
jgi:hypothetical protein